MARVMAGECVCVCGDVYHLLLAPAPQIPGYYPLSGIPEYLAVAIKPHIDAILTGPLSTAESRQLKKDLKREGTCQREFNSTITSGILVNQYVSHDQPTY